MSSNASHSLSTAQQSVQQADETAMSSQSGQQQVSAPSQSTIDLQVQVPPVNTGTTSIKKTQFLPNAGYPPLKWTVWYQISEDHLVATAMDSVSEARKLEFFEVA